MAALYQRLLPMLTAPGTNPVCLATRPARRSNLVPSLVKRTSGGAGGFRSDPNTPQRSGVDVEQHRHDIGERVLPSSHPREHAMIDHRPMAIRENPDLQSAMPTASRTP
ncbi:MAG TPA: hypothetical protein VKF35_07505 [Hyphomicrobiaceae bacterium]|nr:hypothetical protein [Hyphomicrobiaceae bacterium]